MNQAFDAGLDLNKRAELCNASNCASNPLARILFPCHRVPGMRLELFHADGDAPLAGVLGDLENFNFDLLPDAEHIRRFGDSSPGNIADVQQRIYAAEVNEG